MNAETIPNKFRCGNFRKWSNTARRVFNETYGTLRDNQRIFLHPKQDALTTAKWNTVAWNAAWIAADAADAR